MDRVIIKAPAHLHTGNFDLNGELGRLYGTVGFAVDVPIEVVVEKSENGGLQANEKWAKKYTRVFSEKFGIDGIKVEVKSKIKPLVGLGYVTTVALAIGKAISELYRLNLSVEEIALTAKRGLITAMGIYAFKNGGFIVEGGFRVEMREKMVPPLIFRGDVPENWFFVIAVPENSAGKIVEMREKLEDEILFNLPKMPAEMASELSRLVLVKMIPAFIERDLKTFGESLTAFNAKLGEFWGRYQKSKYCDEVVEGCIEIMLKRSTCACQSSWGPTVYSIVEGRKKANELSADLKSFLEKNGGGDVFCVNANNRGAEIFKVG